MKQTYAEVSLSVLACSQSESEPKVFKDVTNPIKDCGSERKEEGTVMGKLEGGGRLLQKLKYLGQNWCTAGISKMMQFILVLLTVWKLTSRSRRSRLASWQQEHFLLNWKQASWLHNRGLNSAGSHQGRLSQASQYCTLRGNLHLSQCKDLAHCLRPTYLD